MNAGAVLLALDVLNASLKTAAEVQALMQKAAIENRDVTDEEVQALITANQTKLAQFKAGMQ